MVRFFFDLMHDGVLSPDDTGLEFGSDDAATREAAKALAEMSNALLGSDKRSIAMVVRDESGAQVCTLTLALSVAY